LDYSNLPSDELVSLCSVSQDVWAWREFVRRFQRPISLVIYRVAKIWGESANSVVDDLVQDTFLKLCANECSILREFRAKHSDATSGYLRVIALNVAHDYFRSRRALKRGGDQRPVVSEEMDPLDFVPAVWGDAEQIETEVQLKEIEHLLDTASESDVSKRDRVIFRLYYKQGMTAKAIASIPTFQLSTKGVESSLARTTRFLRLQISGSQMYRPSQTRQGFLSAVPPEENR
jgi:RNA polymerase sigma factor (sigma-70 family)